MSVYNRIRIEILWVYGLPFWHVSLMVPLIFGRRTWRTEDNGRLENESRDISVQSLFLNALAYWPVNKIGRGQPRRHLDNTLLFCRRPIKLSMCLAWGTWCACIHLVIIVAICSAAVQQCSNAAMQWVKCQTSVYHYPFPIYCYSFGQWYPHILDTGWGVGGWEWDLYL